MSGKILLHICCAPCAIGAFEVLENEGFEVTGWFYNPNIHPLIEFRRRLKAVKVLRDRNKLDILCEEDYGLTDYLRQIGGREDERCSACYEMRLDNACAKAKQLAIPLVTTTLLGSPHQDIGLIARIGHEQAAKHEVKFLERNFRPLQEQSHEKAQKLNLYLQQYCGCIFSEYERYKDTKLHLYRGEENEK